MSIIDALILGIVQGLTEFLPVSSSGHLEVGSKLLTIHGTDNLLFSVIVHGATALSTIVVFRRDIGKLIVEGLSFKLNESTRYIFMLAISMVPVGIVGLMWEDKIEGFFGGNIVFVGGMLIITALLLGFAYYKKAGNKDVSYLKAFIIGIAQAFAILPGISRSGATISMALLLGMDKVKAARFSFLMVLAPIIGANILKIKDLLTIEGSVDADYTVLLVGFFSAFISGIIACRWMINIVNRGKLIYFAVYCLIVGILVIISF